LINRKDVWLYGGVIDVANMPVIDFEMLTAQVIKRFKDENQHDH
jgi:hypothetical protein